MNKLEDILERIKQSRAYAIALFYGEDIGCDDLGIPQEERRIVISWFPAGYLGAVKMLWRGHLAEIDELDVMKKPIQISNPPKDYPKEKGLYVYGTEEGLKSFWETWEKKK